MIKHFLLFHLIANFESRPVREISSATLTHKYFVKSTRPAGNPVQIPAAPLENFISTGGVGVQHIYCMNLLTCNGEHGCDKFHFNAGITLTVYAFAFLLRTEFH